jgi:hypothetical protein
VTPSLAIDAPEAGDLSQIDLFAEQLDLAVQMVHAGGVARGRMALVATDNLAEVLLYRHIQLTFLASEEVGHFVVPRYDQRERQRLRQEFDRRVTLATIEHTAAMTFMYPKPILDTSDATIFRVAHRYRNAIYHEDPSISLPWVELGASRSAKWGAAESSGVFERFPTCSGMRNEGSSRPRTPFRRSQPKSSQA